MSVHQSPNCGGNRVYVFRPLNGQTFRFRVKAPNDANICLSGAAAEVPHHMFEIFLGGWGGGESGIRRNKKDDVCKVKTPNILNANEFMGFWVVVTNSAIKIGRERESKPFLTFSDAIAPIRVTHYGYCTAYGARGSWIFADEDPTPFEPESVMINQPLQWIPCRNGSKCAAPVPATVGRNPSYVAAAHHQGEFIPGVLLPDTNACYISWGGTSIAKPNYFLLSNPGGANFTWQSAKQGNVPMGALEGGYTVNGEKLFIGRFSVSGTVVSGKVHCSHKVCYVPYWGSENKSAVYEVLCLQTVPFSFLGVQ
ncbi:uncharacterized protein LOC121871457 isoform X2 [Homarus americanus]|uniref:uncharacterized protein LOC121871457 isoform X2 n=1 Tax=Homarus americanus TaxID=6706 RepID=UPI001C446200|nr:uncharacterized protein LOC121871457 isoform X2 [Homarus americanus]